MDIIKTDKAPKAIGPYSQAVKVKCGQLIFCSGTLPLSVETMAIVGETAAEQCKVVMENLKAVLAEAGADFKKVTKTTIYLADMNDFMAVNEIYGAYFPENPPARATIEVSCLPKNARVEIEAIAVI